MMDSYNSGEAIPGHTLIAFDMSIPARQTPSPHTILFRISHCYRASGPSNKSGHDTSGILGPRVSDMML